MTNQAPQNSPVRYYDSDYPSERFGDHAENFDDTTVFQGLRHDVERYLEIAADVDGEILELCCGTGRVAMPLADAGHTVTGVDLCDEMLQRFEGNLTKLSDSARARITRVKQDVTTLDLDKKDFRLCILAFNSLLCIPDFDQQRQTLCRAAEHLTPAGLLVLDIVSPLKLSLQGNATPIPFFTRKSATGGRTYTRFAMCDAIEISQRQRMHGWYDEVNDNGGIDRTHYSFHWRPVFRFEIELMLEQAGFVVESIHGGHRGEAYSEQSPRMFIRAHKK
ncbi:MAG: class I SAM-dependent methyltransferase [bacterium]|nr:class I SAM-dependent methyltransferase [bacterium]